LRTVILLLLLVLGSGLYGAFWKTDGQNIVNPDGEAVILRGVGLGGWLVPEGYMLRTPGFGSPSSIRAQFESLLGPETTDEFFQIYRNNYVNEKDIEKIAELGYNSIRLPFHYALFYDTETASFNEEGFTLLDTFMVWCKKNNLPVILDMHCAPGGQSKDNIADGDGVEARLWTVKENQDLTVEIWKEIARRYANEPWIIGYDLLNEPVLPPGYSNQILRNFYIRLINTIRSEDANHIVFIEGNIYATNFDHLTPPMALNMVYAFHKYWSETTQASIQYMLNIRNQYNVPLWLGESGENSNTWFRETIDLMEKNNIGWNWWTHKKIATITSPYSATLSPEYQVILDYLDNGQTKPSFEFARDALFGMAEDLSIENCKYHPDVVAALFDERFDKISVPYTANRIPGTINAVDFDIGINGVAYSDKDYKRERWDVWQPWNHGGAYRNDGVDIEPSGGTAPFPYNVGWTEDGEWFTYTVDILSAGSYDIVLTIAGTADQGRMDLYLDDSLLIANIDIPNTGNYQNWKEIYAGDISLPPGTHRLKATVKTGGFNLNQLKFVLKNSGNLHILNDTCLYGQNYPNPFNEGTTIPVVLNRSANLAINIFNALGKKVRTIVSDNLTEGRYEFKWDGTNDHGYKVASGAYIYKLAVNEAEAAKQMMLVK